MAFPTVNDSNSGVQTSNVLNHTVLLPATVNAGEILMVSMAFDGAPSVTWDHTTAGAWTVLTDEPQTTLCKLVIYWRRADGTEGGKTLTVTTGAVEQSVYRAIAVGDVHATQAPVVGTAAKATSANPNPPNVVIPWGAGEDSLVFAVMGNDDGRRTMTVYPANYTNGFNDNSSGVAGCGLSTARREVNAANEDPAAATISASQGWVAQTVAMRGVVHLPREGTFVQSDAADALAATGTVLAAPAEGTLIQSDADDAVTASGVVTDPVSFADLAVTDDPDGLIAAGAAPALGTLAQTDATDGVTATAAAFTVGALAQTDATDGLTATGVVANPTAFGTLSVTDAEDAVVFDGIVPALGALAQTDATDGATASATALVTGTATLTDTADGAAASAGLLVSAVAAAIDADDSAAASAQAIAGAAGVGADADDTLAAQAGSPAAVGTLSVTDAGDEITASGTAAFTPVTGTAVVTDAEDAVSAGATAVAGASLGVTDASDTVTSASTAVAGASLVVADASDVVAGLAGLLATATLAGSDDPDALVATGDDTAVEALGTLQVMDSADVVVAIGHAVVTALLDIIDDADGQLYPTPVLRPCLPNVFSFGASASAPVIMSASSAPTVMAAGSAPFIFDIGTAVTASALPPSSTAVVDAVQMQQVNVAVVGPQGRKGEPGLDGGGTASLAGDIVSRTNNESFTIYRCTLVRAESGGVTRMGTDISARLTVGLVFDESIPAGGVGRIITDGTLEATLLEWDNVTGQTGGLTIDTPYFAATNGQLSVAPPTSGSVRQIGVAISSTQLLVRIQPVFHL